MKVKTSYRERKEARDRQVYDEYQLLMSEKGAMSEAVTEAVMKKFKIYSRSCIWNIRKRVEKRLAEENASQPV